MSSSHLFLGLPARLPVFAVELRPQFPLAAFFVHLSSLCEAILMANLHFNFLSVSIQHEILNVRIFSSDSLVLLLI